MKKAFKALVEHEAFSKMFDKPKEQEEAEIWSHIEGEMPDPNILADLLKETNKGKESKSKDFPWKSPYEDDNKEQEE